MADCDLDNTKLIALTEEFAALAFRVFGAGTIFYTEPRTVIETLALMNKLADMGSELIELLQTMSADKLACWVLQAYDISGLSDKVDAELDDYIKALERFEGQLENIPESDELSDIESAVEGLFGSFESEISEIEIATKALIKEALSPLTHPTIGVSESEIDKAVEETPFGENPGNYLKEVFFRILELVYDRM